MRRAALLALLALGAGCRPAMISRIENHGPPVTVSYQCGDSMFQATLATGQTYEWSPTANACHLDVGPAPGRRLTLRNECRHDHGCRVTARLGIKGASVELPGSGRIEVDGDDVRKE